MQALQGAGDTAAERNLLPEADEKRASLTKWAELLSSGRADDFKEQELVADFRGDVFCGLLG